MIRVTIELVPHGDESRKKTIGTAVIINKGIGTQEIGNYEAINTTIGDEVWSKGIVKDFPRLYRSAWDLLYLALKGVIGERND